MDNTGVRRTRVVYHPGEASVEAPKIDGWECVFVGRVGGSHTTFTYEAVEDEEEHQPEVYGVDWNF